jgi:hypothetical protein
MEIPFVLVFHAPIASAAQHSLNAHPTIFATRTLVMCSRNNHNTVLVLPALMLNAAAQVAATTAELNSKVHAQLVLS